MSTILFATDGSEYADRAAERAVELARERDATLHVLCVVDRRRNEEPSFSATELRTITVEDHGHTCIADVSALAERHGVSVEGTVVHGIPHEVIVEYADDIDANAIVFGEHGDHREHLGGVRRKVMNATEREILVVGDNAEPGRVLS